MKLRVRIVFPSWTFIRDFFRSLLPKKQLVGTHNDLYDFDGGLDETDREQKEWGV